MPDTDSPATARSTAGAGMMNVVKQIIFRVLPHAPEGVQRWVEEARTRRGRRIGARTNAEMVRRGYRLVSESGLAAKYPEALRVLRERGVALGDYLEFGVFHGHSLACMYRALQSAGAHGVRLFGFDSFEGLPEEAGKQERQVWYPGQFSMDIGSTRRFLTGQGVDWKRVFLVKGWFSETLTDDLVRRHRIAKASVIMVDCDLYSSARDALRFCAPLIRDTAVVFFDDWYTDGLADENLGEKRAFDEFLAEHPYFSAEDFGRYDENSQVYIVTRTGG